MRKIAIRTLFWPHRKKRLATFPSPAGMSLSKLSLGGNNLIFPAQGRVWYVTSRLGMGMSLTFFTVWYASAHVIVTCRLFVTFLPKMNHSQDLVVKKTKMLMISSQRLKHLTNSPWFNPSILTHSGLWGAADDATVLLLVERKPVKTGSKFWERKNI